MKEETSVTGFISTTNWHPTMKLRWKAFPWDNELQQLWQCNNGQSEWRKIEIVD